ncbi:MAG: hypothetical protein P4L67_04425 [Candidatus Pacebacteria bacterium]|nr:hypothetical protein [Candidatus Paceibacterota bacterium]
MIDPYSFYRKPLDEQSVILEKEAEQLCNAVKKLWEADKDYAKYKVWRQACDFYTLTFQHRTFVQEELFDRRESNEGREG